MLPQEPADPGHPLIAAWRAGEPWVRRRLVLTPHAAFYSPAALEDMQRKSIEVCVAYLTDGTLMNCVNRQFLAAGGARQAAPRPPPGPDRCTTDAAQIRGIDRPITAPGSMGGPET